MRTPFRILSLFTFLFYSVGQAHRDSIEVRREPHETLQIHLLNAEELIRHLGALPLACTFNQPSRTRHIIFRNIDAIHETEYNHLSDLTQNDRGFYYRFSTGEQLILNFSSDAELRDILTHARESGVPLLSCQPQEDITYTFKVRVEGEEERQPHGLILTGHWTDEE